MAGLVRAFWAGNWHCQTMKHLFTLFSWELGTCLCSIRCRHYQLFSWYLWKMDRPRLTCRRNCYCAFSTTILLTHLLLLLKMRKDSRKISDEFLPAGLLRLVLDISISSSRTVRVTDWQRTTLGHKKTLVHRPGEETLNIEAGLYQMAHTGDKWRTSLLQDLRFLLMLTKSW